MFADKFQWLKRERLYWARRFGAPVTEALPEGFPASTADVQTALAVIGKESPEALLRIADRLFNVFWAQGDSKVIESGRFLAIFRDILSQEEADTIMPIVQKVSFHALRIFEYSPLTLIFC